MKNLAYLFVVILTLYTSGCMHIDEDTASTKGDSKSQVKSDATSAQSNNTNVDAKSFISVDGISLTDQLPKRYVLIPPSGKKTNILFEQLKNEVEQILKQQGYVKATEPANTELVIVMDFAHNSREGQIAFKAYDAQATLKLHQKKKPQTASAENYKLLASTLVYYIHAEAKSFRESFREVLNTAKGDLLKDLPKTKHYKY